VTFLHKTSFCYDLSITRHNYYRDKPKYFKLSQAFQAAITSSAFILIQDVLAAISKVPGKSLLLLPSSDRGHKQLEQTNIKTVSTDKIHCLGAF
jgi:hypothetical protein